MDKSAQREAQEMRFFHKSVADWLLDSERREQEEVEVISREDSKSEEASEHDVVWIHKVEAHTLLGVAASKQLLGSADDEEREVRAFAAQTRNNESEIDHLQEPEPKTDLDQSISCANIAQSVCVPMRNSTDVLRQLHVPSDGSNSVSGVRPSLLSYAPRHAAWHLVLGEQWQGALRLCCNLQALDLYCHVDHSFHHADGVIGSDSASLCGELMRVIKAVHSRLLQLPKSQEMMQMDEGTDLVFVCLLVSFQSLITPVSLTFLDSHPMRGDFVRFYDLRMGYMKSRWWIAYQYALAMPCSYAPHQQAAALYGWWTERCRAEKRVWVEGKNRVESLSACCLQILLAPSSVYSVATSPDGQRIASGVGDARFMCGMLLQAKCSLNS